MNIPLNIDYQQILLHLFNFVILFAILYFLLYSPVKKFMDERQQYFKDMEDEAKANLADAKKARADYEEKLHSVSDEISALKQKAYKDAEDAGKLKIEQSEKEAEDIIKNAKIAIERDRKKMIADAKNEISDIVSDAVTKIVSGDSTLASYDAFLDTVKEREPDE